MSSTSIKAGGRDAGVAVPPSAGTTYTPALALKTYALTIISIPLQTAGDDVFEKYDKFITVSVDATTANAAQARLAKALEALVAKQPYS